MKINWNKKYNTLAVYCCIIILFAVITVSLILNFESAVAFIERIFVILSPLTYGFIIAFLVNPVMKFCEKRIFKFKKAKKDLSKLRRVLSLISSMLFVFALIGAFIGVLVPQIVYSYKDLELKMSDYVLSAQSWVEHSLSEESPLPDWLVSFINVDNLVDKINEFISDSYKLLVDITPYVFTFVGGVINELKNALIGIIFSVYFLYSKERIGAQCKRIVHAFSNRKTTDKVLRVANMSKETFEGFIVGKIVDSVIIGVLTFFVLMIFDMPYYPIISLIVGVTNIIPFFGPFVGAIPSAFIIFIADPVKSLWFILIILIIQQIDGNIIGPKILGYSTNLSALGVMLAIIIMGGLFGFTGMLIGVPIFSILHVLIFEVVEKRLSAQGKPINIEAYYPDEQEYIPEKAEPIVEATSEQTEDKKD